MTPLSVRAVGTSVVQVRHAVLTYFAEIVDLLAEDPWAARATK